MASSLIRKILYLLVTLIFIYLWFRLTDINLLWKLISEANLFFIAPSIIVAILASIIVSFRLKILFKIIGKDVPWFFLWSGGYVSGLSTIILPFFTGGFLFSYLISKKIKSSYVKTFSIVFADFCLGISLAFLIGTLGAIRFSIYKPVVLFLFLSLIIAFAVIIFRNKLKSTLKLLTGNGKILLKAVSLTLVIYLLGNISLYLFFLAFGIMPNFVDFILVSALFGILNLIPGAPTKIGQYETLGLFLFSYLLNIDKSVVLAILLSQHVVVLTLGIVFGLLFLPLFDINYYFRNRNNLHKFFSKPREKKVD